MKYPAQSFLVAAGLFAALVTCDAARAQDGSGVTRRVDQLERNVRGDKFRLAQLFGRPPADVPDEAPVQRVQDATGLLVRLDRLENQIRTMNGDIEQLQFQNRKLEEQLRKFQQDVDFRFQEAGARAGQPALSGRPPAPQKRTDLSEPGPSNAVTTGSRVPPASSTPANASASRIPRGDAFDPTAQPTAPGAPRSIGTIPADDQEADSSNRGAQLPSGPITMDEEDPNAPLDLSRAAAGQRGRTLRPDAGASASINPERLPRDPSGDGDPLLGSPPTNSTRPGSTVVAGLPASSPRDEFDMAVAALKQAQFETAENGFRSFLQKMPKDRLAPQAVYYLGDSYFQRNRFREAAEQFLKVSTDYPQSGRAPDALLRLGQSLNQMGAKEQACATYQEIGRKYPSASAATRTRVDAELRRAHC